MKKTKGKVFVGMSGGVDSSVAAALLKKQGYEVVGVHLKCFNVDGCAAQDAEDARRAAEHLGIPFYTFDFEKEYKEKVVEYMIDGYKKGITPNPDVMCNKEIKFGLFYDKARSLGADFVATGHYVRLGKVSAATGRRSAPAAERGARRSARFRSEEEYNDRTEQTRLRDFAHETFPSLQIAKDKNKDQSYFLWTLRPEQLKHCLFPIGDYKKPQVRKLAAKFGLHNALKKDSQGICFLGQVSLPDFLKKYIRSKTGAIINDSGEIIGKHNGAHFYTIGQRHGLNIGGFEKPLYVSAKDVKKNIIVVAEGDDNPALYKKEIQLTNVNFLMSVIASHSLTRQRMAKQSHIDVYARVRYRQPLQKAKLYLPNSRELENKQKYILRFDHPMKFVAPGQSAVFYDKKCAMLGGGIIE